MAPIGSGEIVAGSASDRDGIVGPGEAGRTMGAGAAPDVVRYYGETSQDYRA